MQGTPHWKVEAECRQKEVGPGAQASLRVLGWSAWGSRVRPDGSIQSKKRTVVSSTAVLSKSYPRGLTLGGGETITRAAVGCSLGQQSPTFLASGMHFMGDSFSTDRG